MPSRSSHSRSSQGLRPLHLPGARRLRAEPRQFLVDGGLDLRDLGAAGGLHVQPAQRGGAGEPQQPDAGRDGGAVAAHQPVVEPGRHALAEDGERQLGRVALTRAVARQPVGGHQRARRDLLPDLHPQLRADDVGERAVAGRHLAVVGRDGAEVLLDPSTRLLRVDVADDRQDRVVRRVVRAEERARVVQRRRVQIGHGADGRVVVRVALGIGQRGHPLERGAVGHVVVTLPALVLDHVPLVLQGLLVERRQQRAHAVRLQPERQLQLVRGHGLEVVGALEARRPVERPASALDQLEVAVSLDLRRTLKHQVLEEVSQASAALDLVPRADVIPEADRRDRIQVILGEHEAQAVVQAVLGRGQAAGTGLLHGYMTHGRVHPFGRGQEKSCHCMKGSGQARRPAPVRWPRPSA